MLSWIFATALAISSVQAPAADSRQAQPPEAPPSEAQLLETAVEAPAQIMAIPPELKARADRDIVLGASTQEERFERLIHFLFDADGLGLSYREDATHSIAQTYATRQANCVSFTLLLLALAQEIGLHATPQGIRETLSWRQDDRTLYRNSHVDAVVRVGMREYTVDFAVEPVIARHGPRTISMRELFAQYYNNLGMEALAQQRLAAARSLMTTALALDPNNPFLWSNAGVLHAHEGDTDAARRAYEKALTIDPNDGGALFNMTGLAHRLGDARGEAEFGARLERAQRSDPFYHFLQAAAFEQRGDYPQAIAHYLRAIRLHGREARFYAALGRAYRKSGDLPHAIKALRRAEALSEGAAKKVYAAERSEIAGSEGLEKSGG